jgi:hypothetical protein
VGPRVDARGVDVVVLGEVAHGGRQDYLVQCAVQRDGCVLGW